MGSIYLRGHTWWIRYRRNGRNLFESAKSTKKMVAVELLKKREGRISDGLDPGASYDKVTYKHLRQDIVNDYEINGKRIDRLNESLKHLDGYFEGFRANRITTSEIKAYTNIRLNQRASNGTINRELAGLKRMFHLGRQGDRVANIPYIPMLRESNPRQGFFEHEEYLALLQALPADLRPVVTFAYRTGWRKREILDLTWDRVDLKERLVTLNPNQTKNKEARSIYLDDELLTLLKFQNMRRGKSLYVFHRNEENIKCFRKAWKKACKEAKIEGKLFHDFRRTAARNLTRSGTQETVAMRITGHKTRSVFDRYNITSQDDIKRAVERQAEYLSNEVVTKSVTFCQNSIEGQKDKQAQIVNINK